MILHYVLQSCLTALPTPFGPLSIVGQIFCLSWRSIAAVPLVDAGANLLELGVPFSDPAADGPVPRVPRAAYDTRTTRPMRPGPWRVVQGDNGMEKTPGFIRNLCQRWSSKCDY